jgi:hypothetical protein
MLNKSSRVWAPWFGMGCKAQTTAIAQLRRGFATLQTAQNRDDRAARDLFSVALMRHPNHTPVQAGGGVAAAGRFAGSSVTDASSVLARTARPPAGSTH